MRRSIEELPGNFDCSALREIWESCVSTPAWTGQPTWFHSDLHSGNLLARRGELVAVIDFEGSSVGDPSSDLIAAWWLFDQSSRKVFRATVNSDSAPWRRGMGWALYMSVTAISYYRDTNPGLTRMARHAINQILSSN